MAEMTEQEKLLVLISTKLGVIESQLKNLQETTNHNRNELNSLRSRMDKLDGAKGLAIVLIAVIGAIGGLIGWTFSK
jgi:butyrate kinase